MPATNVGGSKSGSDVGGASGSPTTGGASAGASGGTAGDNGTAPSSGAGGAGGAGGSGGNGGTIGAAGMGPVAGSGADCRGATLVPDLHASCIEELGAGRLRIRYDFSDVNQALDWAPSTGASVSIRQRALIVASTPTEIGAAIFKKKLHVDRASFKVILLSGNTTNWYINTIWSGYWDPPAGFGGYHDYSGRGFIINGSKYDPDDVAPLSVGVLKDVTVAQSDAQLTWTEDGATMTANVGPLPVTDRIFALGAWDSSAAFYDVVFDGTLN